MNPWPDWHRCNAYCDDELEHAFVGTFTESPPPPKFSPGQHVMIAGVWVEILEHELAREAPRDAAHADDTVWLTRVRLLVGQFTPGVYVQADVIEVPL